MTDDPPRISEKSLWGPDGPLDVETRRETHTADVYLTRSLALKVRKRVDLGVVDYRSRAGRLAGAQAELALGRRLSPSVYLDLWSLRPDRRARLDPETTAGEPALVMRRLPDERNARSLLRLSDAPPALLDPVVARLASLHAEAPVDDRVDGPGAVAHLRRAWEMNFALLAEGSPLTPAARDPLWRETAAWLDAHTALLEERIRSDRVRDGHGDLRLEHVFLTDPVTLIDPLEVDWLRVADVALDVGFLAMELDGLGRHDAATRFVSRYAHEAGDPGIHEVLPFFCRYLALVRARVAWIRAQQLPDADAAPHRARSERLIELALSYEEVGRG